MSEDREDLDVASVVVCGGQWPDLWVERDDQTTGSSVTKRRPASTNMEVLRQNCLHFSWDEFRWESKV